MTIKIEENKIIINGQSHAVEKKLVKKLDRVVKGITQKNPKEDAVLINEGKEGRGKCQPAGSKVLMANGDWKNIEEIKEGDLIISPQEDGSNLFSKVTKLSKWYCKENYDVVQLNKIHKKLYSCSDNHLIPVYRHYVKQKGHLIRINTSDYWKITNYTAKEFSLFPYSIKKDKGIGFSSFKINEYYERKNCEIEPYCLGVFLGDGSFSSLFRKNRKNRKLCVTNSDSKIMEEVSKYYPIMNVIQSKGRNTSLYDFSLNGDFSILLSKEKLEGKGSGEKFIPQSALFSDYNYRIRLLAGLIDTDGYYSNGRYSFTQKSKKLLIDMKELVYSLGGRTGEIIEVKKKCQTGVIGTYYKLSLYLGNDFIPLQKNYKKKNIKSFYLSSNRIAINVKKSKSSMVYGFSIDSPSKLYITNNWMVTHNTNSACVEALYVKTKTNRQVHLFFNLKPMMEFAQKTENMIIIWDEPALDSLTADQITNLNKDMQRFFMTIRNRRHFFIINYTKFWKFPEYMVVDRANGMVHMREIKIGRFQYIRKKHLESLWRAWRSKHKRDYRKCSSFGGVMPNILERYFKELDFFVNDLPHANYEDYEKEKAKAVGMIGAEKKTKRESVAEIRLREFKSKIAVLWKNPPRTQLELATALGVNRTRLTEWARGVPLS